MQTTNLTARQKELIFLITGETRTSNHVLRGNDSIEVILRRLLRSHVQTSSTEIRNIFRIIDSLTNRIGNDAMCTSLMEDVDNKPEEEIKYKFASLIMRGKSYAAFLPSVDTLAAAIEIHEDISKDATSHQQLRSSIQNLKTSMQALVSYAEELEALSGISSTTATNIIQENNARARQRDVMRAAEMEKPRSQRG